MRLRHDQRGMTLLEVLVATAVAALVLTACYGLNAALHRSEARVEQGRAAHHLARVLYDRLGRELRSLYQVKGQPSVSTGQTALGEPYLQLIAYTQGPTGTGVALIRYQLQAVDDGFLLLRGERPLYAAQGDFPLIELAQVSALRWKFHDGSNWQDEWQSSDRPRLVRFELELPVFGGKQVFATDFDLPGESR